MFGGKLSRFQSGSSAENEEKGRKCGRIYNANFPYKKIVKGILKVYKIVFKTFRYMLCACPVLYSCGRTFMTLQRTAVLNPNVMTGCVMSGRGSCVRLPAVARDFSSRSRDRLTLGRWGMKHIALAFCSFEAENARSFTSTFLSDFMALCLIKHKEYLQYITNKCRTYLILKCFLNCSVLNKRY